MKVYGIKNCNSVKKSLIFLNEKNFEYEFLDIKKLDEKTLKSWLEKRSFGELINTAGTTAKKLELNKEKLASSDEKTLFKLILENPSLIKRPVIEKDNQLFIGKEYELISK
ncbi:ArsC/Spx/MgsR family protein [Campylobacter sp. MIT 97-5078]|uniref:ArsC/Spx/MgsR family protein n=1 Tax=Campylobacter sp. MIT 97-5078 TaxID=1548153 RepID=UPI0005143CE9|nr:ArsC/Spx/MgsR family protein [Campylobacter sp. MIT 97-5078]KGI55274.1 ArsC family transcriptional regulator [Campylobacter sp. MIT 97-5078]TQR23044.1 ArsC family transcriptional regulator [Campylobacter sp. MIT 97-5078]